MPFGLFVCGFCLCVEEFCLISDDVLVLMSLCIVRYGFSSFGGLFVLGIVAWVV